MIIYAFRSLWAETSRKFQGSGRFGIGVIWNGASLAVLGLSGLAINSLILSMQGAEALGVFNQVFAFHIILSQVAVGGLQFSVLRYVSQNQEDGETGGRISASALLLVAGLGALVSTGLWASRGAVGKLLDSDAVATGIGYMTPGLFLFSLNKVLLMQMNGARHMRAFAVFQSLRFILILAGVAFVACMKWPAACLALSLTIAEVGVFAGSVVYCWTAVGRLSLSPWDEAVAWMKRHISFGLRGCLSGVLVEMNTRVDVLLLGMFLPDRSVGIYSFGAIFAEGFAQIGNVIRQNFDPIAGKCFAEGDTQRIGELTRKVRRLLYPLMGVAGGVLVMVFPVVIWTLSKGDAGIWGSWGVFAILVAGVVASCGYRPFTSLLLQAGRPGMFSLLIGVSVVVNAALNFALIPQIGIYGSAVATAVVFVLEGVAIVVLGRRYLRVHI